MRQRKTGVAQRAQASMDAARPEAKALSLHILIDSPAISEKFDHGNAIQYY